MGSCEREVLKMSVYTSVEPTDLHRPLKLSVPHNRSLRPYGVHFPQSSNNLCVLPIVQSPLGCGGLLRQRLYCVGQI